MNNPITVDGRPMTVAEFESAKGLHVGGSLNLKGTGITALPDGLHVNGALDLSGTGITALPDGIHVGGALDLRGTGITAIGKDRRGYEFFAVRLANGPRVIAGCRNFSPAEARAHWAEGSECRELAEKCIAAGEVV